MNEIIEIHAGHLEFKNKVTYYHGKYLSENIQHKNEIIFQLSR